MPARCGSTPAPGPLPCPSPTTCRQRLRNRPRPAPARPTPRPPTPDAGVSDALHPPSPPAGLAGLAILVLSGLTGDKHLAAPPVPRVRTEGPAVIGLVASVVVAIGLRSGGRG